MAVPAVTARGHDRLPRLLEHDTWTREQLLAIREADLWPHDQETHETPNDGKSSDDKS